ncbi:MAG: glycine--tRNA ligase subunit beta [Desulfobacteraceae bacterium]|nr:glycine--tRNA ligase subunit beta [Desulfobacteraceae bacterium]MBC2757748.1 glycine--tRNA ligase subunit beta [Desulfobacteraceae bacterium]
MNRLLVEIGTEEIPAGYILPALESFSSILLKKMAVARIAHGEINIYGTPRRLTIIVEDVAGKQAPISVEMMGPPERIGKDDSGNLTVPGRKFAEKIGVSPKQLKVKETEKGRYLYAVKTERGIAAKKILKVILPESILSIYFPKTMRWSNLKIQFARPIHSIAALLGKDVIPFQVGDVKSGRNTFGHRFMAPKKLKLSSPDQYFKTMSDAFVMVDISRRKEKLVTQMNEAVARINGRVIPDDELVDTVTNLIEYPAAVVGRFDNEFLDLPREILITSMRVHQKYFAVVDYQDNLMPYFVAVNNTKAHDLDLVAKGHERVLRARLADAQFFFNTDLKSSLDEKKEKLKSVLFQADLGSMYDKTHRIEKLTVFLAATQNMDENQTAQIARAAGLCKSDLISHVVVEFPKLQGIMGRVYAQKQNEPGNVAAAIEEHYRPMFAGGCLPEIVEGAVLSISDKIDSICGCFSIGLIPTGASDPYALRRQANGIILISLENKFTFSLNDLIKESLKLFDKCDTSEVDLLTEKIIDFLKGRMAHLLEEEGISKDAVAAVLSVSKDNIPTIWTKTHALQLLKAQPDFEILATAFKRVVNIIKKADSSETVSQTVSESLFEHDSESALFNMYKDVKQRVDTHIENGNIDKAFSDIASMRESVDRFFDDVMVMAENIDIRRNRLALLGQISGLFELLADFSKIST